MTTLSGFVALISLASWAAISSADDCPELYRRYSAQHIYCRPPNTACEFFNQGVSDAEKEEIVRVHNELRSKVAMGKETIGPLPPASNMLQMEWDDELAAIAQKHANQCDMHHETKYEMRQTKSFRAGQSLALSHGEIEDGAKAQWESRIKFWYKEIEHFDPSVIRSFDVVPGADDIGHFTQVIWARTWKVGCGYSFMAVEGARAQLYTCDYGFAANMRKETVYEEGEPASKCPLNTCSGSKCGGQSVYDGLCQVESGKTPKYMNPSDFMYYCDFDQDCEVTTPEGMKQWTIEHTASGSYAGIVLQAGESSILNFTRPFPAVPKICISVAFRKGPNVDGEASNSVAKRIFHYTKSNRNTVVNMSKDSNQFRNNGMTMPSNEEITLSFIFSVPEGATAQYFEITNILAKENSCH